MDLVLPFRYSLDALGHLLSNMELNRIIIDNVYRCIFRSLGLTHQGGLWLKIALYAKHFLELKDVEILRIGQLIQFSNLTSFT